MSYTPHTHHHTHTHTHTHTLSPTLSISLSLLHFSTEAEFQLWDNLHKTILHANTMHQSFYENVKENLFATGSD